MMKMYDRNNDPTLLLIVADRIVGDGTADLPEDAMHYEEEHIRCIAADLQANYPQDARNDIWCVLDLRRTVDHYIDDETPLVKEVVYGNHFFSEAERQKIVALCAERFRKRIQKLVKYPRTVRYKIMPNGKLGLRLE